MFSKDYRQEGMHFSNMQ